MSQNTHDKRAPKTWFITGTSRGFGRAWTVAALERGDQVAATVRDISKLDDLVVRYGDAILPLTLDIDDREADFATMRQAYEHFGRLDVVVNNAGAGQYGMIEEISEQEVRALFETNVFGALWITQAAVGIMREQGGGHLMQVSSAAGIKAFPNVGMYNSTKWTLEGVSEALAQEVADFGIKVTILEPAWFATDMDPSAKRAEPIPAYDGFKERYFEARKARISDPGSPEASAAAVLTIADFDEPPLRVLFGDLPLGWIRAEYASRLETWEKYQYLAELAQG